MRMPAVCVLGFCLDLLLGDPRWLYHPVRLIGALIKGLERLAHRLCREDSGKLFWAGVGIFLIVSAVSAAVPALLLRAAGRLCPWAAFALEIFWCWQILAARSLQTESMKVYAQLKKGDLEGARRAVSMIVGRDTENLDEAGVIRAAVETVAENTADGVTAPLLFLLFGGVVGGFFYKAVNTMDSMIGYKEKRYRDIGCAAARADDILNYLPSRICALLMTASAFLLRMNGKNAWKIFLRDRKKHASPNSAQTESVCAGALGIRLGGDAWYFGQLYKKETIGDPLRDVEAEDIPRAVSLMYGTALLTLLVFGGLKVLVILAQM